MNVRHVKCLAYFLNKELEYFHSLRALHVVAERLDESSAMSRHINLRKDKNIMSFGIVDDIFSLLLGVEQSGLPRHVHAVIKHWKYFALEPPCLVFSEMPVENVHLELRHHIYFPFKLLYGNV